MWTADKPFNFEGRYYSVKKAFSEVHSAQQPHVPIYFGGASDAAIRVGARHADVYALFGEPRASVKAMMDRISAEAAQYNHQLRFNVSLRPIIAPTEGAAWDKARGILARLEESSPQLPLKVEAEFSRRLTRLADEQEVYDERLWMGLVKIPGQAVIPQHWSGLLSKSQNPSSPITTLGMRGVLIRGFDPFNDVTTFGKELIPRIRALVAEREAQAA